MKRLALALTAAAVLLVASPAQAAYRISRDAAEHYTRDYFKHQIGYTYVSASCRPQRGDRAIPPFEIPRHHRWVCGFATGDSRYNPSCTGQIRISGSSNDGYYNSLILWHEGKCPRGVS